MELDQKQLKSFVQETVKETVAELRPKPMPGPPGPVTEIVIRSGASEAVQVLGKPVPYCPCPCLPPLMPFDDRIKTLLQRIEEKTGEKQEDLVSRLELRLRAQQVSEEIERYAEELGIG